MDEMMSQLKMLCRKFLWSPQESASSEIAWNNLRGLNKIPCRKYEIVWSKSITKEPASAVGKSPVILPIITPANTCVGKVIWNAISFLAPPGGIELPSPPYLPAAPLANE